MVNNKCIGRSFIFNILTKNENYFESKGKMPLKTAALGSQFWLMASFNHLIFPHVFRRSCATELIKSDANLYHVKHLLGHDMDTLKSYVKLHSDLQRMHGKCHPSVKID